MPARNAMVHRCSILRDTQAQIDDAKDEWGNQLPPQFESMQIHRDLSCRYWYSDAMTEFDSEKRVYTTGNYLMLPIDTDVLTTDMIGDISDRAGRLLLRGPLRIDELGSHERDHLIVRMTRVY